MPHVVDNRGHVVDGSPLVAPHLTVMRVVRNRDIAVLS